MIGLGESFQAMVDDVKANQAHPPKCLSGYAQAFMVEAVKALAEEVESHLDIGVLSELDVVDYKIRFGRYMDAILILEQEYEEPKK